MKNPLLPCLVLALATTGCGTVAFKPAVQSVGEYKNTAKVATDAEEMPEHSAEQVKVLIQALPEGMEIKDGTFAFDHEQYELLGKVTADYKDPSLVNMGFWFYGYKEGEKWRTPLCSWQVPLSWVTLTMWSWLSPSYYPCRVKAGEEEERRADIVETMQRATKALGGNLVVVAGFGGVNFLTVNSRTGAVVAANSVGTLNGEGYAFKITGAPRKVAPEPGAHGKAKDATTPPAPVKGALKI